MRNLLRICFGMSLLLISISSFGQFNGLCRPAIAQVDLDINNVRATMLSVGDMWWDLVNADYEIPKGSKKHSIFCGNIWMGGLDGGGQLHVAAGTYRQSGIDFWPGPLDTISGGVIDSTCNDFDRFWKINRADVESFVQNRHDPNYIIPEAILSWPGNGNTSRGVAHVLAPFNDVDGDWIYDPMKGDYPMFTLGGQNDCEHNLLGDQAIWWVFNDKGNSHTETNGAPLGFEIQTTAFAYRSSNDQLNDATFYRHKIINRSATMYHDMWFANWWDTDLGSYDDDYVGCDVARGMGYTYNGDSMDGWSITPMQGTYGLNPPAIGMDFLGGPQADGGDMVDNDHDLEIDEAGEHIALATSLYYVGDWTAVGEPYSAETYYLLLHGYWRDGTPITYGGNAYGGQYPCQFMFPGDSDPYGWGTDGVILPPWTEITSGNTPSDRRQMNSVGPFTMEPGEVEVITVGIPWARDMNGDNFDALDRLKEADDYIQTLFDNCFSIPCVDYAAPDITAVIDEKLAYFTLIANGTSYSWDFGDGNHSTQKHPSHYYTSPGTYYVGVNVTSPCGTASDIDTIIIKDQLNLVGPPIWRLEGQGNGKQELEFSKETMDEILLSADHRSLFPMYEPMHGPVRVSYEDYNALEDGEYRIAFDSTHSGANWKMWKVGGIDTVFSLDTIAGGSLQRVLMWGLGVQVEQVNRIGYGSNVDHNGFLTSSISFANTNQNWLTGIPDAEGFRGDNWIRGGTQNGTGVCVVEFNDRYNGTNSLDPFGDFENAVGGIWGPYRLGAYQVQPNQQTICYEAAPAWTPSSPAIALANKIENLSNVDVVFTSDKTKWTRCPVIETGPNPSMTENGTNSHRMRSALSVDKNGLNINTGGLSGVNNPEAADYIGATGMGWFPGYAINLETGERLNLAFGENSALPADNGRDMLWNPTERVNGAFGSPIWGGMHYVFVFGHYADAIYTSGVLQGELSDIPIYDYGKAMHTIFASSIASSEIKAVYSDAMWMTIPILQVGHTLLESDVTVKLRVQKPYSKYLTDSVPLNRTFPLYGFRIDKENLGANVYEGSTLVYPNPFTDECVLQFSNIHNHNASVQLYDMNGKLVRSYDNILNDRLTISGAGLYSGVYIWRLNIEGEEPETGRVVFRSQ